MPTVCTSPLDVSTSGEGGPEVNKFEQVSSDGHHQISLAGGLGSGGVDLEIPCLEGGWEGFYSPMSRVVPSAGICTRGGTRMLCCDNLHLD